MVVPVSYTHLDVYKRQVLEYLVLPQIAGVRRSLYLLGRVNIGYVALGALLEVASLASYAQLTKAVLPPEASSFSRIWRIDLSTLAVSHVLPGGTAGGDGLGYRLLTNEGTSGSDAGLALAIQGIGSALVLNAILWLALIVSVPVSGLSLIHIYLVSGAQRTLSDVGGHQHYAGTARAGDLGAHLAQPLGAESAVAAAHE